MSLDFDEDIILTTKHFNDAGFEVEELYPHIFLVRDFIPEEAVDALKHQFSIMTEDDWKLQYTKSMYEFIENQYGVKTIEEAQALGYRIDLDSKWIDKNAVIADQSVVEVLNDQISAIFRGVPKLIFCGAGSVQRQYEGVNLNYHIDSESNPLVAYACVMYVNGDFTDGELHFPKIDIKFKPSARDLVIFPSAPEYLHGVLPVGPGPIRYALPAFINKPGAVGESNGIKY